MSEAKNRQGFGFEQYWRQDRIARLDAVGFAVLMALLLLLLWVRPLIPVRADIQDLVFYREYYNAGGIPGAFGWGSAAYVGLTKLARALHLSADSFMFLLSAAVLAIKLRVLLGLRGWIGVRLSSLAFLVLPTFFLVDFFELRNAVAQALLMLALYHALLSQRRSSFFAALLAMGFHFSALPFIFPIYLPLSSLLVACVALAGLAVMPTVNFDLWLSRFRGHGGAGVLAAKSSFVKLVAQSVGGYLVPLGAFFAALWRERQKKGGWSEDWRIYSPVLSVVILSLLFFVALWLIPGVPDALYHRLHRVGWFGFSILLLLISRDRWLCWLLAVPITMSMFGYYAYLFIDLRTILA